MLEQVISGGQTGADQAGWRAARAAGIATGGRMPAGFATEDGPRPEFARKFGTVALLSPEPSDRTVANVLASDATLIFAGASPGTGTLLTIEACRASGVPYRRLDPGHLDGEAAPDRVAAWLAAESVRTLNVAGDRESACPGLGARVEGYLAEVFRILAAVKPPPSKRPHGMSRIPSNWRR